jgi:hypothetical protein
MKDGVVQQIGAARSLFAAGESAHRAVHGLPLCSTRRQAKKASASSRRLRHGPRGRTQAAAQRLTGGVAIRPEEIYVGEGPGGLNTISAKVENVEYSGRDSLLDVVTPSGTLLHVRGPVTTMLGDAVRVHVPVERFAHLPRRINRSAMTAATAAPAPTATTPRAKFDPALLLVVPRGIHVARFRLSIPQRAGRFVQSQGRQLARQLFAFLHHR